MKFVDRRNELARLERLSDSGGGGLAVVWGRRTSLFSETFEDLCRACVPLLDPAASGLGRRGPFGPAGRRWEPGGPEWDVVALSLDGTRLLLGEVKWKDGEASARFVQRAAAELMAKGRPRHRAWQDLEVVHALFVPRLARGLGKGLPLHVVEAPEIVGAFA